MKIIKKIRLSLFSSLQKTTNLLPLISLCFLLLALVVPNNKLLFVLATGYLGSIFLITKSFEKTLIGCYFPMSLIAVGQLYVVQAISPQELNHPLYPEGRSLFFTFSPFFAFQLASIFSVVVLFFRKRGKLLLPWSAVGFIALGCMMLLSTYLSTYFPATSLFYTLSQIGAISWGLLLVIHYFSLSRVKKKELIQLLLKSLLVVIFIESGIVGLQFVIRNTTGVIIEQVQSIPYFGAGADENPLQFRPVGFETHANILANKFVNYLFLFGFLLLAIKQNKLKTLLKLACYAGFLVMLVVVALTQSRSAYLGLGVACLILISSFKSQAKSVLKRVMVFGQKYKIIFVVAALFLVAMIGDRARLSLYSFGPQGGLGVRSLLLEEAWSLFYTNPWFGVGLGMFIPAAYQQNPQGVMSYFPESVHNGFVLFLVEYGLVAVLLLLVTWYLLFRETLLSKTSSQFRSMLLAYVGAASMIMLFQPFINFISVLPFIIMIAKESHEHITTK